MSRGEVIMEFGPWKVVDPGPSGTRNRFVVVDTSGLMPAKVYGPRSRKECEAWARTSYDLLRTLHGQVAE